MSRRAGRQGEEKKQREMILSEKEGTECTSERARDREEKSIFVYIEHEHEIGNRSQTYTVSRIYCMANCGTEMWMRKKRSSDEVSTLDSRHGKLIFICRNFSLSFCSLSRSQRCPSLRECEESRVPNIYHNLARSRIPSSVRSLTFRV